MNIPIIRLEVERMKYSVQTAIAQHQALMDAELNHAIDEFCKPENIRKVITDAAHKSMKDAITAEVDHFFRWGDGRKAVAAAVKEKLLAGESYTPLDEVNP